MAAGQRTASEIRDSIERNRRELAVSVRRVQLEVHRATDWRSFVRENRPQAIAGAAIAGFVIGGGIAALGGRLFRRRR
jgi:ElaB/YqjD/DUF883 family membrane-anchored ribosome-binding protein